MKRGLTTPPPPLISKAALSEEAQMGSKLGRGTVSGRQWQTMRTQTRLKIFKLDDKVKEVSHQPRAAQPSKD